MRPLVTVIVPVYNMEDTLQKCINSVIKQTYRNIEIILINDGSTDNSGSIIDNFTNYYNYIKSIHKKNEGVSKARNIGISQSNGDYIMFVDPDDWVSEDIVLSLLKNSISENADIVSCCAQVQSQSINQKNSFFKKNGRIKNDRAIAQLFSNDYYLDADELIDIGVPWGKLYRKKYLIDNNIKFNTELKRNQDNIFNLYAFQHANKIIYIDSPLYYYYIEHFKSRARKLKPEAEDLYVSLAKEVINYYKRFYSKNELFFILLLKRLSNLLTNLLSGKLCNPNFKISYSKRVKRIKEICESKEFNIIFENKLYPSNIKQKIILNLLKNKLYSTTYFVYYSGFKVLN